VHQIFKQSFIMWLWVTLVEQYLVDDFCDLYKEIGKG